MRGFLFFLFILIVFSVEAQNLQDLNRQKDELLKSIAATNKLIEDSKGKQNREIVQIRLIDSKIRDRRELISLHQKEYNFAEKHLKIVAGQLDSLNDEITRLKDEYARIIYHLSISKMHKNVFSFIVGANSFNESYRRFLFLRQYNDYRKSQAGLIVLKMNQFNELKARVEERKSAVASTLQKLRKEESSLSSELLDRQKSVTALQNQEKQLRKEAKEAQRKADNLENRIMALIRESSGKKSDVRLSSVIKENKGKLPWPVDNGIVVNPFGEHPHPVIKNLKVKNNGIDIQINKNSAVKSVFDGVVTRLIAIPGYNVSIIVRHGSVLTVYSNIVNPTVKQDQKVATGQHLGDVYNGEGTNSGILHFELWDEEIKQNPVNWLK